MALKRSRVGNMSAMATGIAPWMQPLVTAKIVSATLVAMMVPESIQTKSG